MLYAAVGLATVVPAALGLLVVGRSTQRRIGFLLVAHGVSVGMLLGLSGIAPGGPAALLVDQLSQGLWIFLFLWLVLIAYLLPDGHLPSRRWRLWAGTGLAGAELFLVGSAGDVSGFRQAHAGQAPPLRWLPETLSDLVGVFGLVLVVLHFFGSVLAVRSRLKRATHDKRLQLLWIVWGALAATTSGSPTRC
jgi:two-component system NarL family sensor kinase